jgi:hypothetical protein
MAKQSWRLALSQGRADKAFMKIAGKKDKASV